MSSILTDLHFGVFFLKTGFNKSLKVYGVIIVINFQSPLKIMFLYKIWCDLQVGVESVLSTSN